MDRYYIIESSPLSPNTVDIVDGQTGKFVASESAWIVGDEGWLGREARHNAEVSGAGTASAGLPGYAGDNNGER